MHRFDYYAPATVAEAVDLLRTKGAGGKIFAGGTDLMPAMKERGRHPTFIVSLKNITELRGISFDPQSGLKVKAGTKMTALQQDANVIRHYPVIVQGAKLIGSLQTQNLATIGGNICNAAPSADAVPAFIVLDATGTVHGPGGTRTVPLTEIITGPGQTSLAADEILTEVQAPAPLPRSAANYVRHVPRKELDIAIAGVGVYVQLDEALQRFTHVRICLCAVAPVPLRAITAEATLLGQPATAQTIEQAAQAAGADARPISDQRGSADFRRLLVRALTARMLTASVDAIRAGR